MDDAKKLLITIGILDSREQAMVNDIEKQLVALNIFRNTLSAYHIAGIGFNSIEERGCEFWRNFASGFDKILGNYCGGCSEILSDIVEIGRVQERLMRVMVDDRIDERICWKRDIPLARETVDQDDSIVILNLG
jgi:hypothetical protein